MCIRDRCRKPAGAVRIENADMFNLKQLCVDIPTGCLVGVTGPSGSGKSTLVFEVLAKGRADTQKNRVLGKEQFNRVVEIGPVSYTHLDVYKRQGGGRAGRTGYGSGTGRAAG